MFDARRSYPMRTTLDIDDDVLESAKELAAKRGSTAGRVLSELARIALTPKTSAVSRRNGVPLLPRKRGERLVTTEVVNRLRDES